MDPIYYENDFDDKTLQCDHCKWEGKGSETILIDLYGLADHQEIHCPNCDAYLGSLKKGDNPGGESANPLSFQLG